MSELASTQTQNETASRFGDANFWRRQLPYLVILILAIVGAYSNISHQPLVCYWEFLVMAMGVVCVFTQWESAQDRRVLFRLILTGLLS
jgi:hypothetical protein